LSFGVTFALIGLAAFFFGKKEGTNRIKMFGGEFESSSPAIIIFANGCAMAIASPFLQATVWCYPSSSWALFVVAGPSFDTAEIKRVNLERAFSIK
jgi:ABC-type Co2+ transport system permease subunit